MKLIIVIALVFVATEAKKLNCIFRCTMIHAPVCGHDGVTYGNECMLRGEACRRGEAITVVSKGECPKSCPQICTMEYAPQCSHDGKVYGNPCMARAAACQTKKAVMIVKSGMGAEKDCDKCHIPCTKIYMPVCGSDGKTYSTECVMREMACRKKKAVTMVYTGECRYH